MRLAFSPIDTWFFRDGTPFDKDASPQAGVLGVFPPYPPTVAGAIRAALARQNGWDGRARWSRELENVLGDGPENLGQLRITGPFVLKKGSPVFPMPRHVLGCRTDNDDWRPKTILRPGTTSHASDLGPSVRFPELDKLDKDTNDTRSIAPGNRQWVTLAGLACVLQGELPNAKHLLDESEIWVAESRVGIAREPSSRTVAEGALYSTRHVRLRPNVSIGVEVEGLPVGWQSPAGSVLPLGGESRLASCEAAGADAKVEFHNKDTLRSTAVLVALTPILLERDVLFGRTELPVGARIESACMDRPLRIGGWDSIRRAPLRMKNAIAPGSTLFCRVDHADKLQKTMASGLLRIGAWTSVGFGLCAVGTAPSWEITR